MTKTTASGKKPATNDQRPATSNRSCGNFTALTPDVIVSAVEKATGRTLAGFTHPLNSYINRVYELQTADRERIIAKFYRPGRWTKKAILDEHDFVMECEGEEIPVVAPSKLKDGKTVGEVDGIFFAVYPKRHGRIWEQTCEDDWKRLGRVIARAHIVGSRKEAKHRMQLHPEETTAVDIDQLIDGGHVPQRYRESFSSVTSQLMELILPLFDDFEYIRVHGDCHSKNILHRPDEGLLLIDFDDMLMGPPVQDMWMLLPGHVLDSQIELDLMIKGYNEFREFDDRSKVLIEPLRAMRMLYFLDWISRQKEDPCFSANFPNWSNDSFWSDHVKELNQQFQNIKEYIAQVN
jgi:Ser/Thr protein kinase RdoA (MazF antagonist)